MTGGEPAEVRLPLDSRLAFPVVARAGRRLAFVAVADEWTVWRQRIPRAGEPPPPPESLFATRHSDDAPAFSPDGRRIVFDSTRGGRCGLYEVDADGPPGEYREIRTDGIGTAGVPCWSADGRWVVFVCRDDESIARVPAGGGAPTRLAAGRGTWPRVYFLGAGDQLCRVPLLGGAAEPVAAHRYPAVTNWAPGRAGVYALAAGGQGGRILYRAFDGSAPRQVGRYRLERPYLVFGRYPGGRLAVSPAEDELLHVEYSRDGSSIHVVDGFH